MLKLEKPRIDKLNLDFDNEKNIEIEVLRIDLIHPIISGNKWFKLKYHVQEALDKGNDTVLTFGGAYSNHIIATACATKEIGLKSIGIIRGEKPEPISHTLLEAQNFGMHLEFISRMEYKNRNTHEFLENLKIKFPESLIVPEGGAGALGEKGSKEILGDMYSHSYSHIICAMGTGTMINGIAASMGEDKKIIGVSVLKGMENEYPSNEKIKILHDYHFGGYAKKNSGLFCFMNEFYGKTGIPTDFVYTGKLFFAVMDLIKKNHFTPNSKLLVIHSGGLQGNESLPKGTLIF